MDIKEAIKTLRWYFKADDGSTADLSVHEASDMAIDALKKQINNGWILCCDRLPENDGAYIVSEDYYSLSYSKKKINSMTELADFENGRWRRAKHINVVAWMLLPQPYMEDEDETVI